VLAWLRHRIARPTHRGIVRDQVKAGQPPEVRAAYERLKTLGWRDSRIWYCLASCSKVATAVMMRECKPFDRILYARLLAAASDYPDGIGLDDLDNIASEGSSRAV
jgi:hypothetical protein